MNFETTEFLSSNGKAFIQSPSNIAIVKYWGKTGIQLPVNPSISFTLKNAVTKTSIEYIYIGEQKDFSYQFLFEGKENPSFEKKLTSFFQKVESVFPWLKHFHLKIESNNTFPHSSGIASSASSYSALALALAEIHKKITNTNLANNLISNCARLGSGSACRSVYGGWNSWGLSEALPNSSNDYAININKQVHSSFQTICDTILIVNKDKKAISSSVGHQLMNDHPYHEGRINQANKNTLELLKALKKGDWNSFIEITESEALSLHGLMMSSSPGYTLLLPNSLNIVQQIRLFREQTNIPMCFTIDAGPNIHLLYTEANKMQVKEFIQSELIKYCAEGTYINDEIGKGPTEMKLN